MNYSELKTLRTFGPSLRRALRPSLADARPAAVLPPQVARKVTLARNIEDVVLIVAHYYQLSIEDLYSTDRHKSLAQARHIAIYLCRKVPSSVRPSFPEIGRAFSRDHTTIMSAFNKIKAQRTMDPSLARQLQELEERLDPSAQRPPAERFVWSEDESGALSAVAVRVA
jgi:hypothetical protein